MLSCLISACFCRFLRFLNSFFLYAVGNRHPAVVRVGRRHQKQRNTARYRYKVCKSVVPLPEVINILSRRAGIQTRFLRLRRAVDNRITAGSDKHVIPRLLDYHIILQDAKERRVGRRLDFYHARRR